MCILVTVALSTTLAAQTVDRIEVKSEWGGLGKPASSRLVIQRKGNRFYRGATLVPTSAVDSLIRAIERESADSEVLQAMGIHPSWLADNAAQALKDLLPDWQLEEMTARQERLFVDSFSDFDFVTDATRYLPGGGLDDCPAISVRISLSAGGDYWLHSRSGAAFLDSWLLQAQFSQRTSHHAEISLALHELLPPGFTNKERLSPTALRRMLAGSVMSAIRDQWDALGAEERLGTDVKPIHDRFKIVKSAIGNLASVDVDGSEAWNAVLVPNGLSNIHIGLSLPLRQGKLVGVDRFLSKVDRYLHVALSPDWLSRFLAWHPSAELEIRFVEDRSLSRKAFDSFRESFNSKPGLLAVVSGQVEEAVLVELKYKTWSRWIVLPDGKMILWHFQGQTVGSFAAADFEHFECYGWRCVGAVIGKEGIIQQ